MKKVLLLIVSLAISASLFAQGSHLSFKGIPIDGNYKEYAKKLVQKGFTQLEATEQGIVLSGTFMGKPETIVLVIGDPTTQVVSTVSALLPAGEKWPLIEQAYYETVSIYKEKYGEPGAHVEEFTADVYDSDSWRINRLESGQCTYKSQWEIEGGRIVIALTHMEIGNFVAVGYVDHQNEAVNHQSVIDDI